MSSRLPIGVGQTISSPGISPCPSCSSIRAIAAAPIMPASAQLGGDDRRPVHRRQCAGAQLAARRLEQQVAGGDHAAADHDHLGLEDVGELVEGDPEPRPIRSKTPTAGRVAAGAASVTALPSIVVALGEHLPSAESGSRSAAARALAAERRARGERLDAAAVRAVALAARPVDLDHDVAELGAGPGRAA